MVLLTCVQVLGAACGPLGPGDQGAAGVGSDYSGSVAGCRGGSGSQQLVQSSVLALQQDGEPGLDGPVPPEASVGGALQKRSSLMSADRV